MYPCIAMRGASLLPQRAARLFVHRAVTVTSLYWPCHSYAIIHVGLDLTLCFIMYPWEING